MAKRFSVAFAATGDKVTVPDATASDGSVSYSQGYTADYQKTSDQSGYKPISRTSWNGIMNDVTGAIGELQAQGLPTWVAPGGLVATYAINALVRYADGNWRSIVANNSSVPGADANWTNANAQALPAASESVAGVAQIATAAEVTSGTNALKFVTPLRLAQWFVDAARQATESVLGLLKVATAAQVTAGTDDSTAVTPLKLTQRLANFLNTTLGYGQTWKNVTANRTASTTYTNTTGRPIEWIVAISDNGSNDGYTINLNGIALTYTNPGPGTFQNSFILPPGATYSATWNTNVLAHWLELS